MNTIDSPNKISPNRSFLKSFWSQKNIKNAQISVFLIHSRFLHKNSLLANQQTIITAYNFVSHDDDGVSIAAFNFFMNVEQTMNLLEKPRNSSECIGNRARRFSFVQFRQNSIDDNKSFRD